MIFWYTGQPGHGKTLHAIDRALQFKDEGRIVYVCNVRGFKHAEAGLLEMTPEQFREWPDFLPDGAVALVDEAYEHGMLPKRGPGMKVPHHVEQLAKHRHRGLDFIFVSQSPARQVDDFVHDLIEQHVHVRRRFGTQFVHLRCFDKFERNPDKAHPIWLKRVTLPRRPRGLYESTKLDTTQKRVPWYYWAAAALAVAIPTGVFLVGADVKRKLEGGDKPSAAVSDGAGATAFTAKPGSVDAGQVTAQTLIEQVTARIPGMPWSAPAFDQRQVRSEPEIYCAASAPGLDANGEAQPDTCSCITEQGTDYTLDLAVCRTIARHGPAYNPYKAIRHREGPDRGAGPPPAGMASQEAASAPQAVKAIGSAGEVQHGYGSFRSGT